MGKPIVLTKTKDKNLIKMMLSPVPVLTTASAIQLSQTAESFPSDISNFGFAFDEIQSVVWIGFDQMFGRQLIVGQGVN